MTALRRAGPQDATALDAFLAQHAATSMFLRSNLAAHGTTFYVPQGAEIDGVFAISNGGVLMAQAPDAPPEAWAAFARQITGRRVAGMTGRPRQVAQCLAATGLMPGPWAVLADEPLYQLTLSDLPDLPGDVRSPEPRDLALLELWYATYALDTGEVLAEDGPSPRARARAADGLALYY